MYFVTYLSPHTHKHSPICETFSGWWVFPGGTSGKEPTLQCRRFKTWRLDHWVRKVPGEGHGNPLQYSCLENPVDTGAWQASYTG